LLLDLLSLVVLLQVLHWLEFGKSRACWGKILLTVLQQPLLILFFFLLLKITRWELLSERVLHGVEHSTCCLHSQYYRLGVVLDRDFWLGTTRYVVVQTLTQAV